MAIRIISKKSLIVGIIILLSTISISAQTFDNNNFKEVDSALYSEYLSKNWGEVIRLGEYADKHNIDYFYLRVRVGIAAFHLEKYPLAAKNLEKALEFNSSDKAAQLYLYDTYLILGKETKAYKLSKSFNNSTLSSLSVKRKIISSIFAGGAYSFSNNFDNNNKFFLDDANDSIQGFDVLIGDKSATYAGISLNFGPSISLFTSFNHLEIQKKINYQYLEIPLAFDSVTQESWGYQNYYSLDSIYYRKSFDKTIKQNEIYLNARFQFNKGWAVTPFGNILFISSSNIRSYSEPKKTNYINYEITGEEPDSFSYEYDEVLFNKLDTSFVNYVVGINIEKDFNNITGSFAGSISNINGAKQSQIGLSAFYFLNSNASLFGFSEVTLFSQRRKRGFSESRVIYRQKFGGKITSKLWIDGEIIYGNLNNTNIDNGYIVYNQVDDMKYKTSASIKLFLNKHIELFVQYQYINYESKFIMYTDDDEINESNTIISNYQTQNIIGGLKWKF